LPRHPVTQAGPWSPDVPKGAADHPETPSQECPGDSREPNHKQASPEIHLSHSQQVWHHPGQYQISPRVAVSANGGFAFDTSFKL
jgi:hypothetical protein